MAVVKVGLTGGIASGKSEVSKILAGLGAYIIDTDILSREVVKKGTEGERYLKENFSEAFINGALDRKILKELVFFDKQKLELLNGIVHPLINEELNRRIASVKTGIIIIVAPLLYETGLNRLTDMTLTVSCDISARIKRIKMRDNIDDGLIKKILENQMTDMRREELSDYVIDNNGDKTILLKKVKEFYNELSERLRLSVRQ